MIVTRFLNWVETAPAERRAEAIALLARAWLYSDMEPHEAEAVETAMTVMLDDPSIRVRRALADALSRDPRAPVHIILALAQDQPDVAEIVLAASPVLLDEDLVDLAATSAPRLQAAIATRPWIAAPLAAAIAEVGASRACLQLVGNLGAELTPTTLRRIAERFGDEPAMREALGGRHDCPIAVRQMLLGKVAEALGGLGLIRATIDGERLAAIMREARDKATVAMSAGASAADMALLAEHLRASGQLTPSLLLRALCTGNVSLFEQALATLAGLPADRVVTVVAECRAKPFQALLQRAGLPRATWPAFAAGIEIFNRMQAEGEGGDLYRFARRLLERVLGFGLEMGDPEVQKLVALLRRFAAESARDAVRDGGLGERLAA